MGTKAYPTNPLPANSGKTHRSRAGKASGYAQRSIDGTPRELDDGGSALAAQSAGQAVADQSNYAGAFPGSRKPLEPDQMSVASSKPTTKSWYPQFMFRKTRGKSRTNTGVVSAEKMRNYWEKGETKDVDTEELTEEDTIIALMGPTGTGKSSFISTTVDQDKGIGHSLESCTSEISAVRVQVPGEDFGLVLVDTPGFDDTHKSDLQILELISDWLERTGRKRILLSGILYLHRISDNRMAGTPLKNLKMFEKLCGHNASSHIVMVTTMWDELGEDEIGERREDELKSTFWAPMLKRGSTIERYKNTKESAWNILEHFLGAPRERQELRLQRELIDMERTLPSTAAGKALSKTINDFVKKQGSLMRTLQEQMNKPDMDKDVMALLRGQYDELERQRRDLLRDVDVLRVPIKKKLREALTSIPPRYLRWFKQEPQSQTPPPRALTHPEPTSPPAAALPLPNPSRAPSYQHDESPPAGHPLPPAGHSSVRDQIETKQGARPSTQQQPPITRPPGGGQKLLPSQPPPPVPDHTDERPPELASLSPTLGPTTVPPDPSATTTTALVMDNGVTKLHNPRDTKSEGQTSLRFPSSPGPDSSLSQQTPHHPGSVLAQNKTSTKAAIRSPAPEPQFRGSLDAGAPPRPPILNNVTLAHSGTRQNEQQPVSNPPLKGALEATAPLPSHTINAPPIQSPSPPVVGAQIFGDVQARSASGSPHEVSRPVQEPSSEAKSHQASGGVHPPKIARETVPVRQPSYTLLSPQPTLNPVLPPHVLPSSASSSSLSLAPKSAQAPVLSTNTPPSKGPRNPKRSANNHNRSLDATSSTRNVPQVPAVVASSRPSLDSSQHISRGGLSDTNRPPTQEQLHPTVTPIQAPVRHPSHTPPDSAAPPPVETESESELMESQEPKRSIMNMVWGWTR